MVHSRLFRFGVTLFNYRSSVLSLSLRSVRSVVGNIMQSSHKMTCTSDRDGDLDKRVTGDPDSGNLVDVTLPGGGDSLMVNDERHPRTASPRSNGDDDSEAESYQDGRSVDVDPDTRRKAFNWCRDFLSGSWKTISEHDFRIKIVR